MRTKKLSAAVVAGAVVSFAAWRALTPDPEPSVLAGGGAIWRLSPLFTVRSLPELAPPSARIVDRDALPDGTVRVLLTGAGNGASSCELRGSGAGEALHCGADVPVLPESARLAKQSDVLAAWGIPRERPDDPSASFAEDGNALLLVGDKHDGFVIARSKKEARFHAVAIDKGERKQSVALPEGVRSPFVVEGSDGSWAFYVTDDSRGAPTLGGTALGEGIGMFQNGSIPTDVTPQRCRPSTASGEPAATVVLLRHGGDPRRWPMAVFHDGRWMVQQASAADGAPTSSAAPSASTPASSASAPASASASVQAEARPRSAPDGASDFGIIGLLDDGDAPAASGWGLPDDMAADARRRAMFGDTPQDTWRRDAGRKEGTVPVHAFTCSDGVGTLTWRESSGDTTRVVRLRCDSGGCRLEETALGGLRIDTWWTAASLGEQVLLVWRAEGVLRMRLAGLANLAATRDVALMDSEQNGGPSTRDLEAFVGNDRVVFLFRDGAGVHGLRIGADGSYRALSRATE